MQPRSVCFAIPDALAGAVEDDSRKKTASLLCGGGNDRQVPAPNEFCFCPNVLAKYAIGTIEHVGGVDNHWISTTLTVVH